MTDDFHSQNFSLSALVHHMRYLMTMETECASDVTSKTCPWGSPHALLAADLTTHSMAIMSSTLERTTAEVDSDAHDESRHRRTCHGVEFPTSPVSISFILVQKAVVRIYFLILTDSMTLPAALPAPSPPRFLLLFSLTI